MGGKVMDKIDYNSFKTEDILKEQKTRDEILKKIAKDIGNKSFDHDDVQKEILNLFNWMNKFYDCSINLFRGLGESYEFNTTFSEVLIKNYGEQMPKYLSEAIKYFCENK